MHYLWLISLPVIPIQIPVGFGQFKSNTKSSNEGQPILHFYILPNSESLIILNLHFIVNIKHFPPTEITHQFFRGDLQSIISY